MSVMASLRLAILILLGIFSLARGAAGVDAAARLVDGGRGPALQREVIPSWTVPEPGARTTREGLWSGVCG